MVVVTRQAIGGTRLERAVLRSERTGNGTLRASKTRAAMMYRRGKILALAFAALWSAAIIAGNSAYAAADPNKILHVAIEAGDDGFDPSSSANYYSGLIEEVIFDRLLTYDYLAEPVKLVPMAAESLPEITDGGKVFTFRLCKGIFFTPDAAFTMARRELTASDVAYSLKRFMDPRNWSPLTFWAYVKMVGLNQQESKTKKNADRFDYDANVAGLEVVDRYTIRIHLTETDFNFAYILASPTTSIVAREVIEKYSDDVKAHPVGTGPYLLAEWKRGSRILLHANPDYRGFVWDFQSSANPWDRDVVAAMHGKQMPQIGVVDVRLMEEEQSRWLPFHSAALGHTHSFQS